MKTLYISTPVALLLCAGLLSCGGSNDAPGRQTLSIDNAPSIGQNATSVTLADGAASGGEGSLLLAGSPVTGVTDDFTISNIRIAATDDTYHFDFEVQNVTSADAPLAELSAALEIAASGSFNDSFYIPLYDIQSTETTEHSFTARSSGVDLPSGNYTARLVINPNWQYAFDVVSSDAETGPYHFIEESNYANNASGNFQIAVSSSTLCTDDEFEHNDSPQQAVEIPTGGQISASLCHDNADYYSVLMQSGQTALISFDYTDEESNPNPNTRYVVLSPDLNRLTDATVARKAMRIEIKAINAGPHYLALYGKRSSYRLTRVDGLNNDAGNQSLFADGTIQGPFSWLHGSVILQKLAFTEGSIEEQVINCGRIATQFSNDQPVAYVTPQRFADIHEFRFLSNGDYLVDGERSSRWNIVDGDISHSDWYQNHYPGFAQKVSENHWRYWNPDGLAYVDCEREVNR